ncbi:MAG: hypothetical protein R3E66_14040 [bacterium]
MSRIPKFDHLADPRRRRFLKLLGAALASPAIPVSLRTDAMSIVMGEAYAQTAANGPTYFMEINLRDQWDFGHVFVSPSLATNPNLRRGPSGSRAALFYNNVSQQPRNFYLTEDSMELAPHLDNIAACETFELSMGRIHGHEAANCTRSPGRGYSGGAGREAMYANEPNYSEQGNEPHFTSTPTPASLHNYWQKQLDDKPARNGVTFKGISRFHNVYHYGAGLPGAELDRRQSVQELLDAFPDEVRDLNVLASPEEAATLSKLLKSLDRRFFQKYGYSTGAVDRHDANLNEVQSLLYSGQTQLISLPLTDVEREYWSNGVPPQVGQTIKANIWEQCAYGFKLLSGGMARTYSVEFDYVDVHDQRTEDQMRVMARQTVLPLVRLIESFKAAGMWDKTLLAVYSLDGGRSPAAASYGNEGKNTVILAGGMIEGGYYGDISVAGDNGDGHTYRYHVPDASTGALGAAVTDNSSRLPGATIWRTVNKALGIPVDVYGQFPDVAGHPELNFMLRQG